MSVTGGRLACTVVEMAVQFCKFSVYSLFLLGMHCRAVSCKLACSLLPVVLNPLKFMPHNLSNAIDNLIL